MTGLIVNPRGRKAKRRKTKRVATKSVARRRRNPARRKANIIQDQIMPAAVAGIGAVGINWGIDFATDTLNLPVEWREGNMRFLFEGGAILGLGIAGDTIAKNMKYKPATKKMIKEMTQGALTVTAYRFAEQYLTPMLQGVSGYSTVGGYENLGYMNTGGPIMSRGNNRRMA